MTIIHIVEIEIFFRIQVEYEEITSDDGWSELMWKYGKYMKNYYFFFFFSIFTREYFVLNILYFHTVMKCWKVIFKPDTIFIVPFYSYWIFFLRLGGFQNDFFRRKILQISIVDVRY